jgi:hypothetical protein
MASTYRLVIDNRSQRSFYNAAKHFRDFAISIDVEERRMLATIAKAVQEEVPPIVSEEAPYRDRGIDHEGNEDTDDKMGMPHLRDSFTAALVMSGDGNSYRISVKSSVPWAQWVETGTRPHTEMPKQAKVMYWEGGGGDADLQAAASLGLLGGSSMGGQPHFASSVDNPGIRKLNKYVERAMKRVGPILRADLEDQAAEFWKRAATAARIGVLEE